MAEWPKNQLLQHGPELSMAERIRRYQENIRTIRASGCVVPTPSMIDTLDPAKIELWFADSSFRLHQLDSIIRDLANTEPDDTRP